MSRGTRASCLSPGTVFRHLFSTVSRLLRTAVNERQPGHSPVLVTTTGVPFGGSRDPSGSQRVLGDVISVYTPYLVSVNFRFTKCGGGKLKVVIRNGEDEG